MRGHSVGSNLPPGAACVHGSLTTGASAAAPAGKVEPCQVCSTASASVHHGRLRSHSDPGLMQSAVGMQGNTAGRQWHHRLTHAG
ncbi:hypothetical protein SRHO_G00265840 [Serrasalmus rhombeus]